MRERLMSRARRIWSIVAAVALVHSMGGPMTGSGVTAVNRLDFVAMHLVTAVVVAGMRRTTGAAAARRSTT